MVYASYETPEFVEAMALQPLMKKANMKFPEWPVDLDFTKTMKMQLIAGRDFQESDFSMMDTTNNNQIFTNPMLSTRCWQIRSDGPCSRPLGEAINKGVDGPVVGVIKASISAAFMIRSVSCYHSWPRFFRGLYDPHRCNDLQSTISLKWFGNSA
jgi:hypothetical protein